MSLRAKRSNPQVTIIKGLLRSQSLPRNDGSYSIFHLTPTLPEIFKRFTQLNALVVGDVMLDTYLFGHVSRMSPEAPVPIVNVSDSESRLGGAANVALNLKSLGASVTICSVIGKDAAGKKLLQLLKKKKLSSTSILLSDRITTEKTRVFNNNKQTLRYDSEIESDLSPVDEKRLLNKIEKAIASGKYHVVIFQDYNKGVLTKKVIATTIALCKKKNIPVAVDPKKRNFFEYREVTLFKPNLREVNDALKTHVNKSSSTDLNNTAQQLHKKLKHQITLLTLSESGIFVSNHNESALTPASERNIADVSGAGDTVISVAALCLAAGVDFKTMSKLANIAGGVVCAEVGVAPVDKKKFFYKAQEEIVDSC